MINATARLFYSQEILKSNICCVVYKEVLMSDKENEGFSIHHVSLPDDLFQWNDFC